MQILKDIESYALTNKDNQVEEKDIMSDIRYICKSCSLITESLQKGCDVMQMPNGDIIITEVKTSTFQYSWDDKKGKLVRVQSGGRLKKNKYSAEKSSNSRSNKKNDENISVDTKEREDAQTA